MEKLSTLSPHELTTPEWFKAQSLGLLALQLTHIHYDGYPLPHQRLHGEPDSTIIRDTLAQTDGPSFARPYKDLDLPSTKLQRQFTSQGLQLDPLGRPLHPWFSKMVTDKTVGAALGNGFYWHYGPNKTADPIVVRNDLDEPHVLLIERGDTGKLALPGGFVDKDEKPFRASIRECDEEATIDLGQYPHMMRPVYSGPLADIRATAHAWPYTFAYAFHIPSDVPINTPMTYKGEDDANWVYWTPVSQVNERLHGSHKLLIELAMRNA